MNSKLGSAEWLHRSSRLVRQSSKLHRDLCIRQRPRQCFSQVKSAPISPSRNRSFPSIARSQARETSTATRNNERQAPTTFQRQKAAAKGDGPKPEESASSPVENIAQKVRNIAPSFTETYIAYGACEILAKECARVADYTIPQVKEKDGEIPKNGKGEDIGVGDSWWYQKLGMEPTFNTWAQITFLHMYLLTVRLRCFPAEHAPSWHQHLTDHFFYMAEDRMVTLHRLDSRMMRNKYLKDLFVQWRGLTAAYDQGLIEGDAIFAAAVWRNVCKGDETIDLRRLAEIVSYMRSVLTQLDMMDDSVLAKGDFLFGDPSGEENVVKKGSKLMDPDPVVARPQKAPAKPMAAVNS